MSRATLSLPALAMSRTFGMAATATGRPAGLSAPVPA